MYILAIETTGPVGSAALIPVEDAAAGMGKDMQINECDVPMKITTVTMSHLKNLMAMISELFDEEGVRRDEIAAVAASVGPGSFTGIRIGASTARALAQALGVPCIACPTLELFRQKCQLLKPADEDGSEGQNAVAVIFNARRGQVYGACYSESGEALIEPGPYMLDEMLTEIEKLNVKPVFYGDGIDAYFDKEEYSGRMSEYTAAPKDERYQTARMVCLYALEKWAEGDTKEYGELLPEYMRESEAEQRLRDGSLEEMRKKKLERLMKMAGKE